MITLEDLMNVPLSAQMERLDGGTSYLELKSMLTEDKFSSTCNVNKRQLQRLIDNFDTISRKIKDYLAYNR